MPMPNSTPTPDSPHLTSPSSAASAFSIVIITLNEAERISHLLDDLCQQSYQNFEVILVDSNSDDATCDIARQFANRLPNLTVFNMQEKGVCLGRNTGAKLAKFERLLFLDADVRLEHTFLEQSHASLIKQQLDVAGVYLSAKGVPKRFAVGYTLFNAGIYATQFVFPTAVGACLFSTKTIHQAIAGFDSGVTLCEDCDYVKRASQITQFRMLPTRFSFDPRRLRQDGTIKTGWKYLYANVHRLFIGEIRDHKIRYDFDHYHSKPSQSIHSQSIHSQSIHSQSIHSQSIHSQAERQQDNLSHVTEVFNPQPIESLGIQPTVNSTSTS